MRKLVDNVKISYSIAPVVSTASANGTGVDTQGYSDAMLIVAAGTIDTASGNETYSYSIEHSDDNSSFSAVSGATTTITASNTTKVVRLAELNVTIKRYVRAVLTAAGTTPSIAHSAVFALGEPYAGPVNAD